MVRQRRIDLQQLDRGIVAGDAHHAAAKAIDEHGTRLDHGDWALPWWRRPSLPPRAARRSYKLRTIVGHPTPHPSGADSPVNSTLPVGAARSGDRQGRPISLRHYNRVITSRQK
jgi:hypothetical protein